MELWLVLVRNLTMCQTPRALYDVTVFYHK
jgi:hypothetical protein